MFSLPPVPDLVIKNAKVIDVFSCAVISSNVAIKDGKFMGVGDYYENAKEIIDINGAYLAPTLVDGHVHIESSMLSPAEFMKELVRRGVGSVVADPHEIANVFGLNGIKYILNESKNLPCHVFVMLPSCVPATEYETSGARLLADDLSELISNPMVLGLGEMMDFVGTVNLKSDILEKISMAKSVNKVIDGHSPMLGGEFLDRYVSTGILTDHECSTPQELNDRISRGMWVQLREGSAAKNLKALLPAITPFNATRCYFCTDDRHPADLVDQGSIDYVLKKAVQNGLDPLLALRMASLNAFICYGVKNMGAIAPGYNADFFIFDDLLDIKAKDVYINGEIIVKNGNVISEFNQINDLNVQSKIDINPIKKDDLALKISGSKANVIGLIKNELITEKLCMEVCTDNGFFKFNNDDICKIVVINRHTKEANMSIGLIKGYGIKNGAIATTVAHDSHNLIAVGDNDDDLVNVINHIISLGGGMAVSSFKQILGDLKLDIAGLMSSMDIRSVAACDERLVKFAKSLGVSEGIEPFMTLSFMSLPVIPHFKITDRGLFDVDNFKFIDINP